MKSLSELSRLSRWFSYICLLLLVLLPIYLMHHWLLSPAHWIDGMPLGFDISHFESWPPSPFKQFLGIALTLIPGFFIAQVLNNLRKLFGLYAQGIFFSSLVINFYNKIATAALRFIIAWIFAQTAMSIAMSYDTSWAFVSVTFTHSHVAALFIALVLKFIAWVMQIAYKLEKENQSFV